MESINGIDVVLLLALLAALFYLWHERGQRSLYWLDGFMAGIKAHEEPTANEARDPYDWAKEGL